MARKIIVMEVGTDNPDTISLRCAFWLAVPAARQPFYADADFVSVVVGVDAPDAGELAALRSGAVAERVQTFAIGKPANVAKIQASLVDAYQAAQAEMDGPHIWRNYGSSWNGTTWTMKTIS